MGQGPIERVLHDLQGILAGGDGLPDNLRTTVALHLVEAACQAGQWSVAGAAITAVGRPGDLRPEDSIRLLLARGRLALATQRFDRCSAACREALAGRPSPAARAAILNLLGLCEQRTGRYPAAIRCHREALALARTQPDGDRESLHALIGIGLAEVLQGGYRRAERSFLDATAVVERLGESADRVEIEHRLALVEDRLGKLEEARRRYERALCLAEAIGHRTATVNILANLSDIWFRRGDLPKARALNRQAQDVAGRLGDERGVIFSALNEGQILVEAGRPMGALDVFRRVDRRPGRPRVGLAPLFLARGYALAYLTSGQLRPADRWAKEMAARARRDGARTALAAALAIRGSVQERSGQWPAARRSFTESLRVLREAPDDDELAEALFRFGRAQIDCGDRRSGRLNLRRAIAIWEQVGARRRVAMAKQVLRGGHPAIL